jgi:DNA-binding MarR family transcriptional regulator
MTEDKILHYLYELEFASVNNLYSRESITEYGGLGAVDRRMRKMEQKGLVSKIPMNDKPRWRRIETFYHLTKKGAKRVDSDNAIKTSWEAKSVDSIYHESMVRDVARSFLDFYDDVYLDFHAKIDNKGGYYDVFPDIYVEADGHIFLVEVERKKNPSRTIREKITNKYEKAKLDGISPKAKILFVYCNESQDLAGVRPQGYERMSERLGEVERKYNKLLEGVKHLPPYKYRFLPFYKFHRLNEAVWDCPDGQKTKLIK